MSFDRNSIPDTNPEDLAKQNQEVNLFLNTRNNTGFLTIEDGANVRRIFPPPSRN